MNAYLTFKALHLIAVISWMAGLLYLPRIFVYHSETKENIGQSETFKLMEKRLYFYIMNPAMILSWFWHTLNSFTRYSKSRFFMDENKNRAGHNFNSLSLLFTRSIKGFSS